MGFDYAEVSITGSTVVSITGSVPITSATALDVTGSVGIDNVVSVTGSVTVIGTVPVSSPSPLDITGTVGLSGPATVTVDTVTNPVTVTGSVSLENATFVSGSQLVALSETSLLVRNQTDPVLDWKIGRSDGILTE